jgi:hypothetical protein
MNKLRLELDSVTVESFATERRHEQDSGTVEAYVTGTYPLCVKTQLTYCPCTPRAEEL